MSVRALLVDDHPVIRSALVTSLVSLGVFESVDTADCFNKLIEMLEHDASYQLLILDLSLADIGGSQGVAHVREHYPDMPVMVFSGSDSIDIIAECFEFGVQGFVFNSAPMQVFANAIRIVLAGGVYIPPEAASLMGIAPPESPRAGSCAQEIIIQFTPRQREVFDQLMQGVPNKIIARRLNMAEGTVKAHLRGVYQMLRVNSRAQAILKSRQLQLIE